MSTDQNWKTGGFYVSISDIQSEGYKEHSGNHSRSGFLVINQLLGKNQFKIVGFAGEQMNQLAWLGVPMDSINKNRKYNSCTIRENDHFNQYHLQFHHIYKINNTTQFNYTIYYNYLNGWYTYDGVHFVSPDLYGYHLFSNFFGGNINYTTKFIENIDFYAGISGYKYNRKKVIPI
jgi:iron complex outermembrane receptor protein